MIAEGMQIKDIARKLGLNTRTVSTYRHHMLRKLNRRSNAEVVNYARDHGLLS